jgi:hypothetical protein
MLAVIIGLVFMLLGLWGVIAWWGAFIVVLKGLVPAMIVCGGFLAVIAGVTSIRDSMESRAAVKESEEKKI